MFEIPEKVYKKFKSTPQMRKRVELARDWDLEFLTSAFNDNLIRAGRVFSVEQVYPIIQRFGKADYEIAKRLEEEFRKFVAITILTPSTPHAPPGAVDMFWHFFILHTEHYMEFSEKVWGGFKGDGKYRHHFPASDETRSGMLRAYWNTLATYEEIFGIPKPYERAGATPVKIWTNRSETSGDSYSGIVEPGDALSAQDLASQAAEDE